MDENALQLDVSSIDIFSLARHGKISTLKHVFELGIDPNSRDMFGNTIIIVAAQNDNKAVVKLALRFGALVNLSNCHGNTALHFCYEYKYLKLANYLEKKEGNKFIKNNKGISAYEGTKKRV